MKTRAVLFGGEKVKEVFTRTSRRKNYKNGGKFGRGCHDQGAPFERVAGNFTSIPRGPEKFRVSVECRCLDGIGSHGAFKYKSFKYILFFHLKDKGIPVQERN